MTAVGQILEEKMTTHHGLHATKLKRTQTGTQAPEYVGVSAQASFLPTAREKYGLYSL